MPAQIRKPWLGEARTPPPGGITAGGTAAATGVWVPAGWTTRVLVGVAAGSMVEVGATMGVSVV